MRHQERAIEAIEAAETRQGLQTAIEKIRDIFSISHVCYHATSVPGLTEQTHYGLVTYDPNWVRRYLDQSYATIDPVVQTSLKSMIPVDWRLLDWADPRSLPFQDEARDYDISEKGMSFPIRGMHGEHALLSINTEKSEDFWQLFVEERASQFAMIAYHLHQKVKSIETKAVGGEPEIEKLSPRELDVFYWLARGKSFQDVGDILFITERTVRAHVHSVRSKLNAINVTHAVAKAIAYGYISPI